MNTDETLASDVERLDHRIKALRMAARLDREEKAWLSYPTYLARQAAKEKQHWGWPVGLGVGVFVFWWVFFR